jgi:hypothetical protein
MIRQFINSGEMRVGEFTTTIGVSGPAYSRFMGQNGATKGLHSDVYSQAAEYFTKREMAGLGLPRSNKKSKTSAAVNDNDNDNKENPTSSPAHKKPEGEKTKKQLLDEARTKYDVSSIHLENEDTGGPIPIYDTCDDLRTKINRHLRTTPGISNAAFIRDLNAALPAATDAPHVSPRMLTTFLNGKGSIKGSESPVFYAAYVFFEKLRVKQGKPKTKKRVEMERVWGKEGMETDDWMTHKRGFIMRAGETVRADKYGKTQFEG